MQVAKVENQLIVPPSYYTYEPEQLPAWQYICKRAVCGTHILVAINSCVILLKVLNNTGTKSGTRNLVIFLVVVKSCNLGKQIYYHHFARPSEVLTFYFLLLYHVFINFWIAVVKHHDQGQL